MAASSITFSAIRDSSIELPRVHADGRYVPSGGYFPLSGRTGFAVLCGYAAVAPGLALHSAHRRSAASQPQARWR